MSHYVKGTLVEAALGAVLITVLLLPFQALFPQYAPYTSFLIVPILLFFALRLPLGGLVALALSFLAGVAWDCCSCWSPGRCWRPTLHPPRSCWGSASRS